MVSGRFRDGFEVGKYRDGSRDAFGTQGRIFARGKPAIRALLARASGHQISSTISVPSSSFAALPAYPRVPLSEQTSLWKRQFWRVPAHRIHIIRLAIFSAARVDELGDDAACRSDPTFTRASPGLAVATGNSLKLSLLFQY